MKRRDEAGYLEFDRVTDAAVPLGRIGVEDVAPEGGHPFFLLLGRGGFEQEHLRSSVDAERAICRSRRLSEMIIKTRKRGRRCLGV